jgi:hypothetical protein
MAESGIWVRSIKYHSYLNVLQEPDTFYQVKDAADLETVLAQRVAVREDPPSKATRDTPPPAPASDPIPRRGRVQKVMTTADLPTPPKTDA